MIYYKITTIHWFLCNLQKVAKVHPVFIEEKTDLVALLEDMISQY